MVEDRGLEDRGGRRIDRRDRMILQLGEGREERRRRELRGLDSWQLACFE